VNEQNRMLIAHCALALARYVPDGGRAARRDGYRLPGELLAIAELLADLAERDSPRQPATPSPLVVADRHAEQMPNLDVLLTKREAAGVLRCSTRQVERLIASGSLHAVKVGGSTRIRTEDLTTFVADLASPRSFRDATISKEPA
jgi:excisionase family DNA binding protein